MKPFAFKTLSMAGIIFSAAAIVICLNLSRCSDTGLPVPSGEYPSTGPIITDVIPHVIMPGSPFGVVGANFDPTPGNNTLTIGDTKVAVTNAATSGLAATLPADFPSGEYPVSVTVNGQTAKYNGTVKVVSIYVAGWELTAPGSLTRIAKYWKNGVATDLTDGKNDVAATSIFVVDKDVHIVGTEKLQVFTNDGRAIYWKNGLSTYLTDNSYNSNAHSVVVTSAGDVYVGGNYHSNTMGSPQNSTITYWKNGVKQTDITDGSQHAWSSSLCVSGVDVYIAGTNKDMGQGVSDHHGPLKYWKNGTPTDLSPSIGEIGQIAVTDKDVYVAGLLYIDDSKEFIKPEYWLNGSGTTLDYPKDFLNTYASSIAISGSNVYIAGSTQIASAVNSAGYWKLGTPSFISLSDPSNDARANSIVVSGSDVFVAGSEEQANPSGSKISIAKFWINGLGYKLTDGTKTAGATAIFIK